MGEDVSKLGVPVFRSRVAPVLNWCSRMLIFSADLAAGGSGREILLSDMSAFDRLRMLQKQGVSTLICGALSPDLSNMPAISVYMSSTELQVILTTCLGLTATSDWTVPTTGCRDARDGAITVKDV